ncbi:MAG: methenyltetrahydromethanopterin cyclohydrolase [Candidatus Thiodiazotropha sp.]
MSRLSINAHTAPLVQALIDDAAQLRLEVSRLENGCQVVDAGINVKGCLEAGRRIAEICLGGLGLVTLSGSGPVAGWPLSVHVHTTDPVIACLGSQYAGWSLSHKEEGQKAFNALGSGPGRILALKEPLFEELNYRDRADSTCLVLEVDRFPPLPLCDKIARDCGVDPDALTLILTPTSSLAGTVQIVARVLEVAMHKAHELGFSLDSIHDGIGSAPLPRSASRDYGRPFAEVFKAYEYDFFKIDPMLFSPARVMVSVLDSGSSFSAGKLDENLLKTSFGIAP